MSENKLVVPLHYRIVEREGGTWRFRVYKMFYRQSTHSVDPEDFEGLYGMSRTQVAIALFRINGGRGGFYLADLKNKKYYYCGLEFKDVKTKLHELGVGRPDPVAP